MAQQPMPPPYPTVVGRPAESGEPGGVTEAAEMVALVAETLLAEAGECP